MQRKFSGFATKRAAIEAARTKHASTRTLKAAKNRK